MSAIFISHSSKDSERAREVERRLAQHGHHSVFLDVDPEKGIVGGQSWERTLYRKLRASRAVIALCTDDYLRSQWCFAEVALARMEGKPVIALQVDPLAADAKMPAILTDRQFIDLRQDAEEGFARLWRALSELDLVGVADEWNPKEPPYLGLSAYQEEHAPVFFGREEESLAGIELLERGAPGLIMVLGASGSGKSSLVRAGIVPRLRAREEQWLIVDAFRPGRDPFAELTESLVQSYCRYARDHVDESGGRDRLRARLRASLDAPLPGAAAAADTAEDASRASKPPGDERLVRLIEVLERLREDPPPQLGARIRNYLDWSLEDLRRISEAPVSVSSPPVRGSTPLLDIADELRRVSNRRNARVLLVIDQFEELLGGRHEKGAGRFLEVLRASIEADHGPLVALGTMRSDFLGEFQRNAALQGIDFESLSLGPMKIEGMRRVIEMPARLAAVEIEPGLVERLLADTETPDALPLLSFTLSVLYRNRRDEGRIEISEYERLGGLQGTIAGEADAVLAIATREHKEDDLRRAFLLMARLSEDGSYARLPADWDSPEIRRVEEILEKLVQRRVLVSRMEGETRVVEVAHEALFRTWQPLRSWLDNARAELLLKQQLMRDAVVWRDSGRSADSLWRGGRLLQARELMGDGGGSGTAGDDLETEFVRAGLRQRQRRRVGLVSTGGAVIAALTGFLVYALVQADRARVEQARALDLARVSVAAELLDSDPSRAALILLDVEDPASTRFAARRLSTALSQGFVGAEYRHPGPVHSVAISADGARVLTTTGRQAMIWETHTGRLLRTLQHDTTVNRGSFDPTGRFVIIGSGDEGGEAYVSDRIGDTAWVWEVEADTPPFILKHDEELNVVAFAPDGQSLVTTAGAAAHVWDMETGTPRFPALTHADDVEAAAFSPDGRLLVTAAGDTLRLWTVATGQPGLSLIHDGDVIGAAFSPDGTILAAAGFGGVSVWDVATGVMRDSLSHSTRSVSFSPDGQFLLTASDDDARVWNLATGTAQFTDTISHDNLAVASFSPDASLVITASGHPDRRGYGVPRADNAVRFWDAANGESRFVMDLTHDLEVMNIALGPEGRFVVFNSATRVARGRFETLAQDSVARLWNVETHDRRMRHVLDHESPVSSGSFSHDGRVVLTVAGTMARLWDADTGEPVRDLDHGGRVLAASFASDGRLVVSASEDSTARVWDVETGEVRFTAAHDSRVEHALLLAGGNLLATLSARTLRLWRVREGRAEIGEAIFEAEVVGDTIDSDAFSPDGRLVAVLSRDSVQVWDVETGDLRSTLPHDGYVRMASFIAEGRFLVTQGDEPVARVWDVNNGEVRHTLEFAHPLVAAATSPDGRTVLTMQQDGTASLRDAQTGVERFVLAHGCDARDAWFIADGAVAVTWSRDSGSQSECGSKVMLWDVATGEERATMGTAEVESLGFSPDGTLMFTSQILRNEYGSPSSLVRVWNAETGEAWFAEPFASDEYVRTPTFSPDATSLLTASGNRAVVWAVGGELLQAAIRSATTACLTPEFRRQNLGASDADARRKYEACEHQHGRE